MILQSGWARLQHIFALQDENWEMDEYLDESTREQLKGVGNFIDSKLKSKKLELGLSRQASMLGDSTFRDFRDYMGPKYES